MENDPIETSPIAKPNPDEPHRFSSPASADFVSSPPAAGAGDADIYITQPTQLLPSTISQIQVPATSPFKHAPPPPVSSYNSSQLNIYNRMAPPGTFMNVPVLPSSPSRNQNYVQNNTQTQPYSQPPTNAPAKHTSNAGYESDGEANAAYLNISDSEDELSRKDLSNIAPAPIIKLSQFSKFAYDPKAATTMAPLRDIKLENMVNRLKRTFPKKPEQEITKLLRMNGYNETKVEKLLAEKDLEDDPDIIRFELISTQSMVKRIKEILPQRTYQQILSAVQKHHNNENDALDALAGEDSGSGRIGSDGDGELLTPIKPVVKKNVATARVVAPKITNKHTVKNNTSLAQKYNQAFQHHQSPPKASQVDDELGMEPSPPQPKRRRLIRGTERVASRTTSPEPQVAELPRKKKITIQQALSDSESEAEETDEEVVAKNDESLLKFFNSCKPSELADLANTNIENAQLVLSKRPFRNLDQIREVEEPSLRPTKKTSGRKRVIGERLVEVAEQIWEGLEAIDRLVAKCKQISSTVASGMRQLNLTTNGNEIDATDMSSTGKDSGIGSPVPSVEDGRLSQPSIMNKDIKLKDHQLVGLNWLNLMYSNRISPILADEMGLGKTATVISLISHLKEQKVEGTHLIVVPGSTLENWVREFRRFSPTINVYAYHGSQAERAEMRYDIAMEPPEVLVTTYEMASSKLDNKLFRTIPLATVVFDEGHMLKNKNSKRYEELMRIKTPWRLLLTGTPVQNNLQELISILAFIMPTIFKQEEEYLAYIFKHRAKTTDKEHKALLSAQRIERARNMMAPFILRRRKEQELKDLPKKFCRVEWCSMTPKQKEVYDDYSLIHEESLRDRAAGKATELRNHLMDRRKAAIHPLLFRYVYDNDFIKQVHTKIPASGKFKGWSHLKMEEEMSWWSDFKIHQVMEEFSSTQKYALQNEEWMDSGKVGKMVELLRKFDGEGSKTLLFSQFTQVLDILESVLETKGIKFCRLDGSTSIALRQQYIDDFYNDESLKVFMLSTKSGGTGINLACANKVIIFDSSFNPHEDVQAESRAHRMGQNKEVEVVRLVTKGTVEEQIHRLGESKLALDQMVSGGDEKAAEEKGMALIEKMLLGEDGDKSSTENKSDKADEEKQDVGDAFRKGLLAAGLNVQE